MRVHDVHILHQPEQPYTADCLPGGVGLRVITVRIPAIIRNVGVKELPIMTKLPKKGTKVQPSQAI